MNFDVVLRDSAVTPPAFDAVPGRAHAAVPVYRVADRAAVLDMHAIDLGGGNVQPDMLPDVYVDDVAFHAEVIRRRPLRRFCR